MWLRKWLRNAYKRHPTEQLEKGWEQSRAVILKPVCKDCQDGLNTGFEQPAQPIIERMLNIDLGEKPATTLLTPREQVIVAAWCVKTGLVMALVHGREQPGTPEEDLERWRVLLLGMLDTETPPPRTSVRVALQTLGKEPTGKRFLPPGHPDPPQYAFSVIYNAYNFLFEVVTTFSEAVLHDFVKGTESDDRLVSIWPPNITDREWPPRSPFYTDDYEPFKREWAHLQWNKQFPSAVVPPPGENPLAPKRIL